VGVVEPAQPAEKMAAKKGKTSPENSGTCKSASQPDFVEE
jgi:hypothetical protein